MIPSEFHHNHETVSVMQNVPFPYFYLNYHQEIRFANKHAQDLFGRTLVEFVNQPFEMLCEDLPTTHVFRHSLSDMNHQTETNIVVKTSNIQLRTVQIRVLSEVTADDQFQGYHVFLTNPTTASDEDYASSTSHATYRWLQTEQFTREFMTLLKTPLSTLSTSLHILRHRAERLDLYLERMQHQLHYLVNIVNDSHLYLNAQRYQPSLNGNDIWIDDLVEGHIDAFRHRFEDKGLTLKHRLPLVPVTAKGYRAWLNVLLRNILENALQFTEVGTVSVAVHGDNERNLVYIIVQDSGIGISDDDLPHIFDPFFRGTNASIDDDCSGLGLTIAQRIVDQHHGHILVDSTEDKGTTVTIILPMLRLP